LWMGSWLGRRLCSQPWQEANGLGCRRLRYSTPPPSAKCSRLELCLSATGTMARSQEWGDGRGSLSRPTALRRLEVCASDTRWHVQGCTAAKVSLPAGRESEWRQTQWRVEAAGSSQHLRTISVGDLLCSRDPAPNQYVYTFQVHQWSATDPPLEL